MHILIIGTQYEPDLGPSASLFTTLSENLVKRGHQVTVISSVPHYPTGKVPVEWQGKWVWRGRENGVEVIRVGLPSINRSKLPQRIFQFLCYMLGAIAAGFNQQYDVVLAGSSALSTWLPFAWFVNLRKKPAIYSVNDVYPDVGIKLGVFKNRFVITVIAALERFCLHGSTIVQIISDSFRPGLRALGVPDSKMALLQLWVDTNIIRPLSRDNSFAVEQGLTDQFVVLYAGNLGRSQGLEHILHAAELLAGERDIRFVFVGDAAGRELLQKEAQRKNLSNVQFIPFQPRDRLPEVLASADISLVVLRRGIGSDSLPSKTFSIMASGRPILASVDEESEAWKLVKRAESGIWVQPEDPHRMAEAILTLKRDSALRERLGCNGRVWTERYHSPEYAAEQFEKLFSDAISLKRGS